MAEPCKKAIPLDHKQLLTRQNLPQPANPLAQKHSNRLTAHSNLAPNQ